MTDKRSNGAGGLGSPPNGPAEVLLPNLPSHIPPLEVPCPHQPKPWIVHEKGSLVLYNLVSQSQTGE